MNSASARDALLDPEFLASLAGLRILARRVPRGGRHAEHRSRDLGGGLEFRDFRPYTPGDDFRSIDWNIYRRLGRVVLRLFEEMEDLPLYLAPDMSASGWSEEPPRALAGLKAALALASISLGQHDPVGLYPFAEDLLDTTPARAGGGRLMVLADRLASLPRGGGTDFRQSFQRLASLRLRPGLLVILSDFFDPAGLEAVLASLTPLRHRLLLVQLLRSEDREPTLQGDLHLLDCETGDGIDLSVSAQAVASYSEAYDRFQAGFLDFVQARGLGYLPLDTDAPLLPQIAGLFEAGGMTV